MSAKKQKKYFTIMLIPDSGAKIKSIRIPHWVFRVVLMPLLCCLIVIGLLRIELGMAQTLIDDSAIQLYEAIDEKQAVESEKWQVIGENLQLTEENESVKEMLDEYEQRIGDLWGTSEEIYAMKQDIVGVFQELNDLNLPISFDDIEANLGDVPIGGASNSDAMAMLTELEFIMLKEFRDMQELTDSAEKLIPYSRARPTGWPTASGAATSGFGNRRNPFDRSQTEYHTGVDIQIPYGSPVYATADGVVAYSTRSSLGYGNLIIIDHAYGYSTLYAHNSSLLVAVGTEVERGQLIAYSGNSGRSLGSHLHYEVRRDNIPLNPQPYM